VRSCHVLTSQSPVLAAGLGVRHGWGWALRSVSFRLPGPLAGAGVVGITTGQRSAGAAVVAVVAGLARPSYGELRVLGEDLTTASGRAAVRHRVGVARTQGRARPGLRVRGLVARAARRAGLRARDRQVMTAAIIDRLGLTAWAGVRARSAPPGVGRQARLAAAAVHEPDLLLLDGLLDGLPPDETAVLAGCVRDLGRDTAIVVVGRDAAALWLACDEVLTLSHGILAG
jgi:ABC-2 type transport system ATP-binding protein